MQINPDFEQFWAQYPRKEAKKDTQKAWAHMTTEQRFAARESIGTHVRFWELAGRSKQYIPLPATWLRGERWEDELEMPVTQKPADEWWKSAAGIQAKGASLGIFARPGEGYPELKARILASLKVTT